MLFVKINGSKGGRNRLSPVLKDMEQQVRTLLKQKQADGRKPEDRLFDKVHSKMDVHSCRREYAKALYQNVSTDRAYRNKLLTHYPKRHEGKTYTDTKTGKKEYREVQSKYFRPSGTKEKYFRDDLYVVSQALGHNRIDVTYHSYLR